MKDGYKKVWITLLIVILCAAGVGLLYWSYQKKIPGDEGILVKKGCAGYEWMDENQTRESEGVIVYGI